MRIKNFIFITGIFLTLSSCAVLKTGKDRIVPELKVQLKINSLHAKQIQEQGVLGTQEGDELALVYSLNAYDEKGSLIAVNNGFWGTRTHQQNALILSDEFDKISVPIPRGGKVIATLILIEVDDYKGERKLAKIKSQTRAERYPKFMDISSFSEDQSRPAIDLIAKSLDIAGYDNFKSRHMNLSINDELGSTRQALDETELGKILSGARSGKETYEMDGSQINEKYLYVLKYDLDVTRTSTSTVAK